MALLNKDFVKWVGIAFVMATPVAWYTMNNSELAYKTNLNCWIFALTGFPALASLITVSWPSWRGLTRNPLEALGYE